MPKKFNSDEEKRKYFREKVQKYRKKQKENKNPPIVTPVQPHVSTSVSTVSNNVIPDVIQNIRLNHSWFETQVEINIEKFDENIFNEIIHHKEKWNRLIQKCHVEIIKHNHECECNSNLYKEYDLLYELNKRYRKKGIEFRNAYKSNMELLKYYESVLEELNENL
jgi:hypothetical protein